MSFLQSIQQQFSLQNTITPEMEEIMQRKEKMQSALIDSQKNWTNLALDVLGLAKLLTQNAEKGVKADSDHLMTKI